MAVVLPGGAAAVLLLARGGAMIFSLLLALPAIAGAQDF
jgi:hypothetical protein